MAAPHSRWGPTLPPLPPPVSRPIVPSVAFTDTGPVSIIRDLRPEAVVTLDGVAYNVGGILAETSAPLLTSAPFLNRSRIAETAAADPKAFQLKEYRTEAPTAPYKWVPGSRGSPKTVSWPPRGLHLVVTFNAPSGTPASIENVIVEVHYEM